MAGATVTNYQANFTGSGLYVTFPSGLIDNYTAVSVEAWVTTGVIINISWARISQFGVSPTTNANSLALNDCGSAASCSRGKFDVIWVGSTGISYHGSAGVGFNSQTSLHVLMTVSSRDYARLYINGVLKGSTPSTVNPLPPATAFFIGKSFQFGDAGLIRSVNEFRIWGGALSASDIARRYFQGPGKLSNNIFPNDAE